MDATPLSEIVTRQRTFTPLGLILRAVRGLLPTQALLVASALAKDPFDLLAQDMPGWRWMRFLPHTDDRASDPGGASFAAGQSADSSVRLAEIDMNLSLRATHPAFDVAGHRHPIALKWRRLDGMVGSQVSPRHRLDGLVICEAGDRALRVLQGSTAVLRVDRPLVALPLGHEATATALVELLQAHDYVVFNHLLQAVEDVQAQLPGLSQPVAWVLALPREAAFPRMTHALFSRDTPLAADAPAWNELLHHQLSLEAGSGGIQFERHGSRHELTISIASEAPRWGFHRVEREGDAAWSWIGPRPRAGIVLPPLSTRLGRVRLDAASSIDLRNVSGLRASINGETVHVDAHWHGDRGHFDLTPHRPSARWRPFHLLELSVPLSRRPNEDEPRMLALSVQSLTLLAPMD